jgi:CRISPR-associated exonuclease Cas4
MLDCQIDEGSPFYGKTRRRSVVALDDELRELTRQTAKQAHELIAAGRLPPVEKGPKCKLCSLAGQCLPDLPPGRSARKYLAQTLEELLTS